MTQLQFYGISSLCYSDTRSCEVVLVESITSGQDLRRTAFSQQEVDNVQETVDTIRVVLTDGYECHWDTSSETDRVLRIKVLQCKFESVPDIIYSITLTASTPASALSWGFLPPSSVCSVKVVDEEISGRNSVKKL